MFIIPIGEALTNFSAQSHVSMETMQCCHMATLGRKQHQTVFLG